MDLRGVDEVELVPHAGVELLFTPKEEVGLIGIIVRDEGPGSAVDQVRRLLRHERTLAGVDLAGDEAG